MWGKGSAHPQRPVIGNPTLVNKTLDDSVYQTLSPITPLKDDKYVDGLLHLSGLLTLFHHRENRDSFPAKPSDPGRRVASSVYSRDAAEQFARSSSGWMDQPLPERRSPEHKPNSSVWHETREVSPPDSPISASGANDSVGSGCVSPIEDEFKPSPGGTQSEKNKYASHLPVLRNLSRKASLSSHPSGQKPGENSQRSSKVTRWDDFSGEPTSSNSGKAGQAAPGRTSFQLQPAAKQHGSHPSGIFGWSKEQFQPMKRFAEARSRLTKHDNTHPPWKGASGRLPMMSPIQEKQRDRASSRAEMTAKSNDQTQTPPVFEGPGFRPTVVTTITACNSMGITPETRTAVKDDHGLTSNPAPIDNNNSSGSNTPPRVDLLSGGLDSALADLKLEEQPSSRFSTTTYEPTEFGSAAESLRDSVIEAQSTENLPSIMSRRRPVPSGIVAGKKPTRKPTPSEAPEPTPEDLAAKPLPDCPPEQQAGNRIDALEARRDTLARRKGNIETIIHELTQVIQPSSVAYDMAAREEVKKTVASLNSELADIKREDHEIGLKLFRAYKKRDDDGSYGGSTSFWVKRVTS